MNLLSGLERLAEIDFAPIHIDMARCLHSHGTLVACDACVQACAFEALHVNGTIELDSQRCVGCRQCVHTCPVGAIDAGDTDSGALIAAAAAVAGARVVELACPGHPSPELGPSDADAVIRAGSCLAALGPSAYAGLLAAGLSQIVVRLDACADCTIGRVQPRIEATLAATRHILNAPDTPASIATINERRATGWTRRPLYAKSKRISRRDFLRRLAGEGQQFGARALAIERPERQMPLAPDKGVPPERGWLLDALRQLSVARSSQARLTGLPFARFTADDSCTACGVCAQVCPSGALQYTTTEGRAYSLHFASGACMDCGACLRVCMPDALHREDATLADLISPAVVVRSGTLQSCTKCGARFASGSNASLCPVCAFRRKSPFGSRLPPGAAGKDPVCAAARITQE